MRLIRLLLFPFSLCYGLVVVLRNLAYDYGLFKSTRFAIPVISIGNLAVGGAGKSPITAHLAKMFADDRRLAILSRGYGRKTKGFFRVTKDSRSNQVGDEPRQFKQQFPHCTVAVCEDRVRGIKRLAPKHDLILLDDAYQHRAVKPGLSILLFDYNQVFGLQCLLPTGDLREPLEGRKRADIILVTKAPASLSEQQRQRCIKKIKPFPHQQLFFSYLAYGALHSLIDDRVARSLDSIRSSTQLLLLTGIARAEPLIEKLKTYTLNIEHHCYADHYDYKTQDIVKMLEVYQAFEASDKLIITTQKDAQRLKEPRIIKLLGEIPVYYLPIQAMIQDVDKQQWNRLVKAFITDSKKDN